MVRVADQIAVLFCRRAERLGTTRGLWVGKFLKTVTSQVVTDAGNKEVAPTMAAIAEAENMKGHALTGR
jgi:histidinol dehydrogenase